MSKYSIEERSEILLTKACDGIANFTRHREASNKEFRKNEKEEYNVLRITIDGILMWISEEFANKMDSTTPNISYQISLSISFIRTHYLIMDMILEGDLTEALTLERKQLEKLTRLNELDDKNVLQ